MRRAIANHVRVLAVLGPSGAGKSTVVRELHRRRVIAVTPSWTTRPRREDEPGDTIEHRFVGEDEFAERQRAGCFLETVRMFGLPHAYGLPPVTPAGDGRVPAIMVRAPVMPLVERHFPDHVAYQIEDGYRRAAARLERRAVDGLGTRLDGYEEERRLGRAAAHRIFVNATTVEDLVGAVAAAVAEDFAVEPKEEPSWTSTGRR